MTSKSSMTISVKVSESNDANIKLKTKIEKLKATGEFGGNSAEYDSEKKDSENNPEMSAALKEKVGVEKELSVDRKTGISTDLTSPKPDVESDPMDDIMKAANGNENTTVNEMFFIIPKGTKVGDTWTTNVDKEGNKTQNKYTLKEVKGNSASIDFNTVVTINQTIPVQGMDMAMNIKLNSNGNFVVNTETGVLIKKTSKTISEGTTNFMGQDSPISMDSTVETIYSEK